MSRIDFAALVDAVLAPAHHISAVVDNGFVLGDLDQMDTVDVPASTVLDHSTAGQLAPVDGIVDQIAVIQ